MIDSLNMAEHHFVRWLEDAHLAEVVAAEYGRSSGHYFDFRERARAQLRLALGHVSNMQAIAIEAGTAKTEGLGAQHESAAIAQPPSR